MQFDKVKLKKLSVVIFLTILIWVWADLALDETYKIPTSATLTINRTNPRFFFSFRDESTDKYTITISDIEIKGPTSKISDFKTMFNNNPEELRFTFNPEQEGWTQAGDYKLDVANVIRESDWIKGLTLSVESCEPKSVTVRVVELEQKPLDIVCRDAKQTTTYKPEVIEPAQINMYVPSDWTGAKLTAYVDLTETEITNARSRKIDKTPYVILADGFLPRSATESVWIKLSPIATELKVRSLEQPTLGFIKSKALEDGYKVIIHNESDVYRSFSYNATDDAAKAYEDVNYHLLLEILDSDKDEDKINQKQRRDLIYNFPPRYVGREEIKANQTIEAEFTITLDPAGE